MKTNTVLIDNYFGLLNSLSKKNKIKLITKLANTLVDDSPSKMNVVDKFYGAFRSTRSAEEIIAEIRESRTFNRKIEGF